MDATTMMRLVAAARVAHLATVGEGVQPHLVPICFALEGSSLYFAVDAKPKRSADLKRLRNIAHNPAVSVLVDHYDEDWTKLWWVRLDGSARIVADAGEAAHAIGLLVERYPQYRRSRPGGPVAAILVERVSGWSGA